MKCMSDTGVNAKGYFFRWCTVDFIFFLKIASFPRFTRVNGFFPSVASVRRKLFPQPSSFIEENSRLCSRENGI